MQDRRGKFWHVRASPSDQAFVGGDLRPIARNAVKATRGQVLTWGSQFSVRITPHAVEDARHGPLTPLPQIQCSCPIVWTRPTVPL